ncbi:MAG: alpha/beta fold hydrolase [Polyangiales bacterium]
MMKELRFAGTALGAAPFAGAALLKSAFQTFEAEPRPKETACAPIVLMHGFAGFRELGPGKQVWLEYFTNVRRQLRAMGYQVFAPQVEPFDDPLDRAKQWFSAIEKIRVKTKAEKVHLVGHSQGGLDARVLVAPFTGPHESPVGPLFGLGYGARVASVTTIATPHFGSVIADAVVQDIPGHKQAVKALMCSLNLITALIRGEQQDTDRAVKALTRKFMLEHFNRIIEDDPNVRYYAVAGDPGCRDVVHPWLRPEYKDIHRTDPGEGGGPNDGLVTVSGSFFGNLPPAYADQAYPGLEKHRRENWETLGVLEADHIAEVGLELRVRRPNAYDHLAFFAGLAQFLDDAYPMKMTLRKDGYWERRPESAAMSGPIAMVGLP